MNIVIFGLAITSSWGNGHATTFRALCAALRARGHRIVFFEKDTYWYADNRDLPQPEFCDTRIYERWEEVLPAARRGWNGRWRIGSPGAAWTFSRQG